MNPDVIFEIIDLALSLAKAQASGKAHQDATLAGILLQIVQKGVQAYQAQTGEVLDPSLIKVEDAV